MISLPPTTCYWILLACITASSTIIPRAEVVDLPTPADFLRRGFHGSAVLGDFLFIDGRELSQLVDGVPDPGQQSVPGYAPGLHQSAFAAEDVYRPVFSLPENNITLSIDLRTSWNYTSLVINSIPKVASPVFDNPRLWVNPDRTSFYLWSGHVSLLAGVGAKIPDTLWKFTSDERGSGTWSQQTINYTTPLSTRSKLLRSGGDGAGVVIGDTAYYVGGRVWPQSDLDASSEGYFPNTITSFNISSGIWDNSRVTRIGTSSIMGGAQIGTVPAAGLGGRGLIVLVGGGVPGRNNSESVVPGHYFDMNNVTLYDPHLDAWYAQKASGDIPGPRDTFCSVVLPGDNGTYEMFIYGGVNDTDPYTWQVYDDIWILSIPGFVWFKVPVSSPARFYHTCEHVGGGQIIIIGGLDNPQSAENEYYDATLPDPFLQGVGVFSASGLAWEDGYEADPSPYQSPQIVKDWYDNGNQAAVQWQSLELARMFIPYASVSVSPTPTAIVSIPISTGSSSNNGNDNKATIIGVVSGLGSFIVALVAAGFGLYRHLQKKKASQEGAAAKGMSQVRDTSSGESQPQLVEPADPARTSIGSYLRPPSVD